MRLPFAIAVTWLLSGCSGSPTSPTPVTTPPTFTPPTSGTSALGGTWTGSVSDSANGSGTMRVELTDLGTFGGITGLAGTWSATYPDATKNASGRASATQSGSELFVTLTPATPPTCAAPPPLGGAGGYVLRSTTWTSSTVSGTYVFVPCSGPVEGRFELRKP